jgi:hypothetical protein
MFFGFFVVIFRNFLGHPAQTKHMSVSRHTQRHEAFKKSYTNKQVNKASILHAFCRWMFNYHSQCESEGRVSRSYRYGWVGCLLFTKD